MQTRRVVGGCFVWLLLVLSSGVSAHAQVAGLTYYTFGFSGHLYDTRDSGSLFGDRLTNANDFSGSYRFAYPPSDDLEPPDTIGEYPFHAPAFQYEVTVGSIQFRTNPDGGWFTIDTAHADRWNPDYYALYVQDPPTWDSSPIVVSGMDTSGWRINSYLCMADYTKTAMDSADLPTTPPDLSRFGGTGFDLYGQQWPYGNDFFAAYGRIDRIWVIPNDPPGSDLRNGTDPATPEPGIAVWLAGCSVVGLALWRRRRT